MEVISWRIRCSASAQATASSIRTVPATTPPCGMTLWAEPARTMPQTTLTPARGSRRRLRIAGSSVMTLPRAKVRSSVRCGREVWPPLPIEPDGQRVGGTGERALAQAEAADVEARVAVQAEDVGDALERTGGDQLQRPAGHDLLGGLEQQSHAPGQQPAGGDLRQREPGPDEPGRVDVVAAGVGDSGAGAPPRVRDEVVHRQRVEVGAQGDQPASRGRSRPAPRRPRVAAYRPADLLERGHDRVGGALLGPAQLGVGVEVAAEGDELVGVLVDDLGDDVGGRVGWHDRPSLGSGLPGRLRTARDDRGRRSPSVGVRRRPRAAGPRPAAPAAHRTARHVVRRRGSRRPRARSAAAGRARRAPAPR